jgi:outer membrane protein OmpA-like peptidoglycan-associated protein
MSCPTVGVRIEGQADGRCRGQNLFLGQTVRKFPDFTTMKSEGSIYTAKWDVPERIFTEGFPGITNRFEWFAIDYQGTMYVSKSGTHGFRMASDDGSMLYIDGNVVINLDGLHAWAGRASKVDLAEGEYSFRLSYMQGPRASLGLQLWVTPPGEKEKLFNLQDFSKAVITSRNQLAATEDAKEIRVNLGAEVLFDTGKYMLRPAATAALQQLAMLLRSYPGLPILIEGHTNAVGKPDANQILSEHRANAVKEWLASQGQVPSGCMMTKGYGETMPVAGNETAEDRQKNRRVEIKVQKTTAAVIPGRSR